MTVARGKLIVLRGNAGSGKSSVAEGLRTVLTAPLAVIEQDYYRHQLLSPWNEAAAAMRGQLMVHDARFLLAQGYTVVLEGVLPSKWFKEIYEAIAAKEAYVYYFDIPFEETVKRHAGRPKASGFGEATLRDWWKDDDSLGVPGERRITQAYSLKESVAFICKTAGLSVD